MNDFRGTEVRDGDRIVFSVTKGLVDHHLKEGTVVRADEYYLQVHPDGWADEQTFFLNRDEEDKVRVLSKEDQDA